MTDTKTDTKVDLRISEELLEKVREVAVERFDARIHHISKQPEVTYTINKLIQIGIEALESGYYQENSRGIQPAPDVESMVKEQLEAALSGLSAKVESLEEELAEVKKLELPA
jgi:hypothetical protein